VEEVLKIIHDSAQGGNIPTEEKNEKIAQAMETYISHITELTELLAPRTPPELRTQREQEVTGHMERIVLIIEEITDLYNNITHLWTNLQEYGKLQELD